MLVKYGKRKVAFKSFRHIFDTFKVQFMLRLYMRMNDSVQRSINTIEAVEHIIDKAEGRNGKE